jgi:phosphatidylglycerophosphate synthase
VLDLACSLALVVMTLVVALAYARRVSHAGAARHARIERAGSSPLLGKTAMEMGYWAMGPMARGLIALGASANGVSWASLVLAVGAGIAVGAGRFGVGALLSVASSMCDALDGMIARETGTASDSGEVLDAAVDRYAELSFLGGLVFHERHEALAVVLGLAATAGAVMVSYATAKAEALAVCAPRGAMRRQERAVYLVLGVALVPIATAACARWAIPDWLASVPLLAMLGLIAAVGNASAVHRLGVVAQAVRQRARVHALGSHDCVTMPRDAHAITGDVVR